VSIWDRVKNRDRIGTTGRRAEAKTARRLGARQTAGSGSGTDKGDLELPKFLAENKSTTTGSIRLTLDWLLKIRHEAEGVGKVPALTLQFTTESGAPRSGGAWVAVPERVFKELTDG